eukprot:scpid68164/ scgid27900/ Latent-transforming growth factor beta-binding protein 3
MLIITVHIILMLSAWNVVKGLTPTLQCAAINRLHANQSSIASGTEQYTAFTGMEPISRTNLLTGGDYEVIFDYPAHCHLQVNEVQLHSEGTCSFQLHTREWDGSESKWIQWSPVSYSYQQQPHPVESNVRINVFTIAVTIQQSQFNLRFRTSGFSCKVPLCADNEPYISVVYEDVDECKAKAFCDPGNRGNCTNTFGKHQCSCLPGYNGITCADIDECTLDKGICKNGVNIQCNNTPGSYQCVCKPGFAGTPCADVNECALDQGICSNYPNSNGQCNNMPGSYLCSCKPGYSGTPCTDINECKKDYCRSVDNSHCHNTNGSYQCVCLDGYSGAQCEDINECDASPGVCNAIIHSNCNNTNGSYQCICRQGYTGKFCQDIDECSQDGAHNCTARVNGENRICENTNGSYRCPCASTGNRSLDEHCAGRKLASSKISIKFTLSVGLLVSGLLLATLIMAVVVRKRQTGSKDIPRMPVNDSEGTGMREDQNHQPPTTPSQGNDVKSEDQRGTGESEQGPVGSCTSPALLYSPVTKHHPLTMPLHESHVYSEDQPGAGVHEQVPPVLCSSQAMRYSPVVKNQLPTMPLQASDVCSEDQPGAGEYKQIPPACCTSQGLLYSPVTKDRKAIESNEESEGAINSNIRANNNEEIYVLATAPIPELQVHAAAPCVSHSIATSTGQNNLLSTDTSPSRVSLNSEGKSRVLATEIDSVYTMIMKGCDPN